jgi:hypothetical protein
MFFLVQSKRGSVRKIATETETVPTAFVGYRKVL